MNTDQTNHPHQPKHDLAISVHQCQPARVLAKAGRSVVKSLGLAGLLSVVCSPLHAQNQTINGNLTVTGSIEAAGPIDSGDNTLTFGTQGSGFGGALLHQDNSTDTFTFFSNRNPASWLWQHTVGIAAMRLDANHQLILYKSDGTTTGITLTPASNSIKLGTHANGTLTADANGVITAGGGFAVVGGITNTNGTLTGGATGLTLNAGGTNQNIALNSSGGDLIFSTASIERMRIKTGGNVGIGTSNPQAQWHVFTSQGTGATTELVRLTAAGGANASGSTSRIAGYSDVINGYIDFKRFVDGGPTTGLVLGTFGGDVLAIRSAGAGDAGSVGIGTTTPGAKLDVEGNVRVGAGSNASWGDLYLSTNSGWNSGAYPTIGSVGGTTGSLIMLHNPHVPFRTDNAASGYSGRAGIRAAINSAASTWWDFGLAGDFFHIYRNGTGEFLRVTSAGNVGIGTMAPTEKIQLSNNSYIGLMANSGTYIPTAWNRGNAGGIIFASSQNADGSGWAYGSRLVNHDYGDGLGLSFDVLNGAAWTNDIFFISGRNGKIGNVGIGTTNPEVTLDVSGEGVADRFRLTTYNNDPAYAAGLLGRRSRGTRASPAGLLTGDVLTGIYGSGYHSAGGFGLNVGAIRVVAAENFTANAQGTNIEFATTNNGQTSRTTKLVVTHGGNVGIGTTTPSEKLEVAGNLKVTGTFSATNYTATSGAITGGNSGLALSAGGTNQSITLTPSGSGNTIINGGVGIGTVALQGENKLTVGAVNGSEGGQMALLPGSSYSTSWMIDNYEGNFRLLKGNASGTSSAVGFTVDANNRFSIGGQIAGWQGVFGPSAPPSDAIVNAGTNNGAYSIAVHGFVAGNGATGAVLDVINGASASGNDLLLLRRLTDGGVAPAVGLAGNITFTLDAGSAASHAPQSSGRISSVLTATNGTNNSSALTFSTATLGSLSEKLRIDNSGNVGIGTTNPGAKLEVAGDAIIGNASSSYLHIGNNQYSMTAGSLNPATYVYKSGTTAYGMKLQFTAGEFGTMVFGPNQSNRFIGFGKVGSALEDDDIVEYARIDLDNGFVGIGTGSPASKLTVVGGHGDAQLRLFSTSYGQDVNGANTALLNLWASEPGVTWNGVGMGNNMTNSNGFVRVTNTRGGSYLRLLDNRIAFNTVDSTGADALGIAIAAGNVGIGTSNPTHKLAVAGTIRAYEVIVDTGWADYVFEEDYRLAPLTEVEEHIKAKKHLPGIPSAAEVAEHGVSMGDMQSKLLSKVEELTLHLIAQEKKLEAVMAENAQLAQRVQTLEGHR